jgi:hypothetical protein
MSFEFTYLPIEHFKPQLLLQKLNALGAEGWQVVADVTAEGSTTYLVLQRPIPQSETPHAPQAT